MSMKSIEIANKILEIMDEQYPSEIQEKEQLTLFIPLLDQ